MKKALLKKVRRACVKGIVYLAAFATFASAIILVGYIAIKGAPYITPKLFAWNYTSENVSLMPALINTLAMTLISLIMALPLGVGAAVFLTEYARRQSFIVKLIRRAAEALAGLPSILYGLFGYLFFLVTLGWDYSILSGAITLSIMILPIVLRASEEALIAVPQAWREGSYALGAGKLRTILIISLPAAFPGILSGVMLAVGRVVGETAALLYTAGTVAKIPDSLMASGRTLSVHLYALSSEALHTGEAFATALILIILVTLIQALAASVSKRFGRRRTGG